MFNKIKTFFGMSAATQPPQLPQPKVKAGQRSLAPYLKSATPSGSFLQRNDRRLINTDLLSYRNGATTRQIMRDFASSSPDLSAVVFSYLRLAITGGYIAVARNPDGSANPEATSVLCQVIARFDTLTDYSQGFSGIGSMRSTSESLGKELLFYGAAAGELVLDKSRLPYRVQPLSVSNIEFKQDKRDPNVLMPVQRIAGVEFDLDYPTFFYTALDQDLLDPYATSPLEPALKPALFSEDFQNDLHRVMKRAIHPRQKVVIDEEKFIERLPSDAMHDPDKLQEYRDSLVSQLERLINGLQPEDALVHFDSIEVTVDSNGNISLSDEYKTLKDMGDSRLATGAKTLPAVLGHEVGSSNVASTSSMLFVKNATAIKYKLDEFYSRALTLAVRLFGFDVYVEFKYNDIDLRPESELESFRQTKQTRVLEQLSLGLISDEEACLQITGHLPPPGYKKLSGTMFKTAGVSGGQGAASGASDPANPSNDGSTVNKNLKPDTPAVGRGQNKKAEVIALP